jgi:PAS domain S-box-containing protein
MKVSFSIAKKIWLSLAILVLGYLISMIAGFILGQNTESRLRYVSEYLFPASRQSQIALSSFGEEIRLYNNAVVTGEKSFIESAASKAEEVRHALESIINLEGFNAQKKKEVKALLEFLHDFNILAQDAYTKLSSVFEEKEDSSEDIKDKDLEEKAFYLARTTKMIQGRLAYFSETYADDLKKELYDVSNIIRRQRYVNILIFFGVVIVTLSLIAIIIRRSIIRPLMRIVDIAEDITAGKNDIQWLSETNNEIGILNSSLKMMTENLKTAEKKYRNIFKNAIEGIFQVRPDGHVISINPSMAKIMGYDSPEELISSGYKLTDRTYADTEHRRQIFDILEKQGRLSGFETQVLSKDGTPVWISLSARIVKDSNGNVLYSEGAAVDITEHKEKEKAELERQIAEEANKKIMSSIRYAKSIQHSLLPNMDEVKTFLPDSFFIWEPRDIVGGDIFFAERLEDGFIIAVVDGTGHGVPGAFMTMIASSGLRKIIKDEGCHNPAEILSRLNYFVKKTLRQDTAYAVSDDGMDAGICFLREQAAGDKSGLIFAGAKLPLICVREGETEIIKGDRQSIGYKKSDMNFTYTNHTVSVGKGMSFYMASDGFVDQLDGSDRRFGSRRLRNLLKEIAHLPFEKQREILLKAFETHKGSRQRQDDVTVAGFGF